MFKSLIGIVEDCAKIVIAPVAIAADVTRAVTKPIADVATDTVNGMREITRPDKGNSL